MHAGFPKVAPEFAKGAPSGYVAGVGRGAVGFSTRSDIGPGAAGGKGVLPGALLTTSLGSAPPGYGAGRGKGLSVNMADAQFGTAPKGYVAGRGRAMGTLAADRGEASDTGDYSESNYDAFAGFAGSLFSQTTYDDDDAEADRIYDAVDKQVEGRLFKKRTNEIVSESKSSRPRIGDQFSDLKAGLAQVSAAEWDALPEVSDHSLKLTQKGRFSDTSTAIPDSLLLAATGGRSNTALQAAVLAPGSLAGMSTSRGGQLGSRLDSMAGDVEGQTVVDPNGYITGLGGLRVNSDAEIGDIKRARLLLSSVTSTNPHHAPGWIAAARLEEVAGKPVAARKIAAQGCDACPKSEDVWLESARLNDTHNAKTVLAQAVQALPESVNIWIAAAALETDTPRKKIVLRRALEIVPGSVVLWKAAIELEEADDARILLGRAVECVPTSTELWLALARLETHENARKVLNRMRQALPGEPLTWITGAQLEEANGAPIDVMLKIVIKMLASLSQAQVSITRERWLQEAEICETAGAPLTCEALITNTVFLGLDDEDRLDTWMSDVDTFLARSPPRVVAARAVIAHALKTFPADRGLWTCRVSLERAHGNAGMLRQALAGAVEACPRVEVFWLLAAKHAWTSGESSGVNEARGILQRACMSNPASEAVWLAGVKVEWENGEIARARALLRKARGAAPSARVWLKSILIEYEQRDAPTALTLADEAISAFPAAPKLYLLAGEICQIQLSKVDLARRYYQTGRDKCPTCSPLWIQSAILEESQGLPNKARSLLETARVGNPGDESLWVAAVRLERRASLETVAAALLARGLQSIPTSGALWAEDLLTCPKTAQKSKSADALQHCSNDARVVLAVARLFEQDRKTDKARKWMQRAVALQPKLGDAWAYLFALELRAQFALNEQAPSAQVLEEREAQRRTLADIESRCMLAEPNKGELWNRVHKRIENHRLGSAQVLRRCVEEITSANRVHSSSLSHTGG